MDYPLQFSNRWGLDNPVDSGRLFPVMKTMKWIVTEVGGKPVDALVDQSVIVGYVQYNNERSLWRLYRGDGQLFFQVYSRDEGMRVMGEIAPSLEFQQCPRVEVGA